jgi:hypothetical protein
VSRPEAAPPARAQVVRDVLAYVAARLVLVVVLAALIYATARLLGIDGFPVLIAIAFALVIALPLGIWLFAPLRRRATAALAAVDERRRRDREQLRARLRGEAPPDESPSE